MSSAAISFYMLFVFKLGVLFYLYVCGENTVMTKEISQWGPMGFSASKSYSTWR